MPNCKFISKEPVALDTYKVPDVRFLCRNPERMNAEDTQFSDRFIGKTDCEHCKFYTP